MYMCNPCSGLFIPGYLIPPYWIGYFDVLPTPHVVRAILLSQVGWTMGGERRTLISPASFSGPFCQTAPLPSAAHSQTYCGVQPCGPVICAPSNSAAIVPPCTAPNESPVTQYDYMVQQVRRRWAGGLRSALRSPQ